MSKSRVQREKWFKWSKISIIFTIKWYTTKVKKSIGVFKKVVPVVQNIIDNGL